ncbi:hypothetical protein PVAP13_5NG118408 [Panicum virgatum]|uniref:Bowman-Birk serine protease inhibitors family domain-containing protein n=1 Tax=Panicum virgatum TaxID=38727 RepID=A0A8T0RNT7_PANVG|nr:hypothetical protein PVAP13_5NG118408 [Panicum virgatum]
MRGNTLMTMLLFVMLFGSLALPAKWSPIRTPNAYITTPTSCNYFTPNKFNPCYCYPDVSQKEYCHLTLEDCRAKCATCKSNCVDQLVIRG